MKEWLKQLFCRHRHKYNLINKIEVEGYDTFFMECSICGKRRILLDEHCKYPKQAKEIFNLWKKHEAEIDFGEEL